MNRAGIIHDAMKLSCELVLDPTIALGIIKYAAKENAFIPWTMIRSKHECLSVMMNDKELKMKYKVRKFFII